MDNIQDLNFEGIEMILISKRIDVVFSMENLELLQKIVHDQILLKIWCIHLKSKWLLKECKIIDIMTEFDPKKLEIIKDIFNTINMTKMLYDCLFL